jgi:hypothetical protein
MAEGRLAVTDRRAIVEMTSMADPTLAEAPGYDGDITGALPRAHRRGAAR